MTLFPKDKMEQAYQLAAYAREQQVGALLCVRKGWGGVGLGCG